MTLEDDFEFCNTPKRIICREDGCDGHTSITYSQFKKDKHQAICKKCKTDITKLVITAFKNFEKTILKDRKEKSIYTSLIHDDLYMIEQIYDRKVPRFCQYFYNTGEIKYIDRITIGDILYEPIRDQEVIENKILLPSKAEIYESDEKLDMEIIAFIRKWLDIPDDVLQFSLWNIKLSWVYQRFHTINYLRAQGDTGMGKSRYLDTNGAISYKTIATSGATTAAPIFRIIRKWGGTLTIDEADLPKSDESQDFIKIINQGYEKHKSIMRCDKNDPEKVEFFDPFCPKILATRRSFQDKATESRCITTVMCGTNRQDIPLNLTDSFWSDALHIRNKLLMWRFRNYRKINPDFNQDLKLGKLEPRVKQIISPYLSLFCHDKTQLESFKEYILGYQESLIQERQNSFEGQVVDGIHQLIKNGSKFICAQDIIEKAEITGRDGKLIKPRGLSSVLKSLGFGKTKLTRIGGVVKKIIPLQKEHIENLFDRYGCNYVTDVTIVTETEESKKISDNGEKVEEEGLTVTKVTTVTSLQSKRDTIDVLYDKVADSNGVASVQEMSEKCNFVDEMLSTLLEKGEYFESKPGYIKRS